jgi:hypothetical protein
VHDGVKGQNQEGNVLSNSEKTSDGMTAKLLIVCSDPDSK